ncbi:MAG: rhodanese-like domain-containing protein [Psychromonas sp.]
MNIAMKEGYSNVRAYVEGYPAWKEEVYPSHVNAAWLTKNLDKHHVILDVRDAAPSFIKGSAHMPASTLTDMHENWNQQKYPVKDRLIMGVRDKKAPIVIIANSDDSDEAIEAYEILTFWKYKNVTILMGGLDAWTGTKETGEIASTLEYVKKPIKGAVEESVFVKAALEGGATIVDVRDVDEITSGRLAKSIHIPLDDLDANLSKIPKDTKVIVHCAGGARAALAYDILVKNGYTDVLFLNDSFEAVMKENNITLL